MVCNVIVDLPAEYRADADELDLKHEEEALCWLWGYPDVFPWPSPVAWLYTPVVGNDRWPGDLWGVDSHGDLIVIEAKQCKRRDDPFKDFVAYHRRDRRELSAAHWQKKWDKHLRAELSFPDGSSERPEGKTAGILPRSNKRRHIRRWSKIANRIDLDIRSPHYFNTVMSYLQTRDTSGDPVPYYVALMIQPGQSKEVFTAKAQYSARELQRLVGSDRVCGVAISCKPLSKERARIEAQTVGF